MSVGVRAAMAAMTGSRPGRAVMTRTMASSSPALSRAKAAGAAGGRAVVAHRLQHLFRDGVR